MKLKGYSKKVIIASVAAILVAAGVMYSRTRGSKIEYETYDADRGEVVEIIEATGSIAPSSKIKLQPQVSGKIREIAVEEGQEVSKGDLLIQLDVGDINAQILAQRASVASAQAKLTQYESGATVEELAVAERSVETARSRLEASKVARDDAQASYDNAVSKADAQLQSTLNTFESDMEDAAIAAADGINRLTNPIFTSNDYVSFSVSSSTAENDAVHTRGLAKSGVSAIEASLADLDSNGTPDGMRAHYDEIRPHLSAVMDHFEAVVELLNHSVGVDSTTLATYRLNANSALSALSTAVQALSNDSSSLDLRLQLNQSEINAALTALNSAKNSVATNEGLLAEAEAALTLTRTGTREEVINAQRALVSAEQARLAGLQNEWEKRRITAPVDGVVTLVSAEPGENVLTGQTVVMLNAKGNLEVLANISEIDIASVSIGDPVDITLDAFSDNEAWKGTVVAIQPAETVVDAVIFYETTVRFDSEDERLRSGMTANLDIETDRREGVLRVPVRALRQDNGDTYVEVMPVKDQVMRKDIMPGLESDDFVEILSGIEEGETVVVWKSE